LNVELKPFDPADYLDSEEGIEAYLEDARLDGAAALSRAAEVVARARARMDEAARRRSTKKARA
jgi:DNA-binding phage protein